MSQHHDPVHPDSEHLTAELLADLDLGLLDAASTAHAEQHLAHCVECAERHADFTELGTALMHLPPEPMPDDVWRSLSATLEAEPVSTPAGSATVVPLDTHRRRWSRPGIGLVAGAAGVALVGAIVVPSLTNNSADEASTASDGGPSITREDADAVPVAAYAATTSGTRYQEAELDTQVTELVSARSTLGGDSTEGGDLGDVSPTVSPTSSSTTQPEPTPSGARSVAAMVTDPAAAQACLEGYLKVPGVQPLAIDIGTWQGEPAAVIVLPADDPSSAEVWVIDPDCDGPDTTLYYFATVPR
jgi:negative regulator of sigma E activity